MWECWQKPQWQTAWNPERTWELETGIGGIGLGHNSPLVSWIGQARLFRPLIEFDLGRFWLRRPWLGSGLVSPIICRAPCVALDVWLPNILFLLCVHWTNVRTYSACPGAWLYCYSYQDEHLQVEKYLWNFRKMEFNIFYLT